MFNTSVTFVDRILAVELDSGTFLVWMKLGSRRPSGQSS